MSPPDQPLGASGASGSNGPPRDGRRGVLVSVVMSVFNERDHLAESVESILCQTERDLELIVVDDGSTDGSGAILEPLARRDPRVHLLRHDVNRGQATALNRGIDAAHGRYVARMDGDDIAEPERLATQISWLEAHPEVGLLGSAVAVLDHRGRPVRVRRRPAGDLEIRWTSLLDNPFMHPTVVLRRELLERTGLRYDDSLRTAQDYDLWTRLLPVTRAANLSDPLVRYRRPVRAPTPRRRDQLRNHDRIAFRTIAELLPGFAIEPPQVSGLRALFVGGKEITQVAEEDRLALCRLYLALARAFLRRHAGAPDSRRVHQAAAAAAARALRGTPVRPGWLATALRVISRDRRLARPLLGHWRRQGN